MIRYESAEQAKATFLTAATSDVQLSGDFDNGVQKAGWSNRPLPKCITAGQGEAENLRA